MTDLSRVVMPLVGVMNDARLSWSQRERVAEAIQHCLIHHHELQTEAVNEQAATKAPQQASTFAQFLATRTEFHPDPPDSFDILAATRNPRP